MKGSHLAIEIADHGVRFVSFKDDAVVNKHEVAFDIRRENEIKAQLKAQFDNESFLKGDFDDVTLSWSIQRSTLVPNAIFAESSPQSIFNLCYGTDATQNPIDYNRIAELSVVNVYELPTWVKHFFVLKFPRIVIQHEGSHLLRKILRTSKSKLKTSVILYQDYFQLIVDKNHNLEFYSFFDYQTYEDVIYHLLFALQQKELTDEEGTLEVISGLGASEQVTHEILKNLGRIKDFKKLTLNTPKNFIASAQLLCV